MLLEAARRHAAGAPESIAFTFLEHGEREAGRLTYARLDLRARAIAARLQAAGAAGAPVAIALPTGLGFVEAFVGCVYAGSIAVPMPDLDTRRGRDRAAAILSDCDARVVLRDSPDSDPRSLAPAAIADDMAQDWRMPDTDPDDVAFLQYTSGSTGTPRGVMVSHAALAANLATIASAFALETRTVGVNWLPLHHDMGLIAGVLEPVWSRVPSVLLPPLAILQNPLRWLAAMARYRGTVSGAPSFAYDACARRLERRPPAEALDLSCWKVAYCGGEPVRIDALERFARAAGPWGFRGEAFMPCYGLAEATLLVSAAAPGTGATVIADGGGRPRADCGYAAPGVRIEIADPEDGAPVAEGGIGEILVSGASVALGYWHRPEDTAHLFHADGRLRTGDLGFLKQGRLAVTGRLKDLLVIRGQNHHPEDIEKTVRAAHPSLAAGAGAAFTVDGATSEELVLVHELERGADAPETIGQAAAASIAQEHGLGVREIVLIRPATLPRTANGKVQRARCREAYLEGRLAVLARLSPAGPVRAAP